MTGLVETIGLTELVEAVPFLDTPVVLLEGGAGSGSAARLAWGSKRVFTLQWSPETSDLEHWLSLLPVSATNLYGFISYDLGLPPRVPGRTPVLNQPLAVFLEPAHEIVLDAAQGIQVRDHETFDLLLDAIEARCRSARVAPASAPAKLTGRSLTPDEFVSRVELIKRYISAGDVYQVNLAVAEYFEIRTGAWDVYRTLREINPSPWMGFADFGSVRIVSGSPELLLELHSGDGIKQPFLRARPIAGTRKKTGDPAADRRMRAELTLDQKERAEHRMLVDLARNDIGRVAAFGTVEVTERETVEEYSHVFHLVSQVEGRLAAGRTATEAIAAAFPGGTITGAPKIRAMEIISELEPVARGAYTGALGWIGPAGFQLNIMIRTLLMSDRRGVLHQGAGIVWDSVPEREWRESLRKGGAVRKALEVTE